MNMRMTGRTMVLLVAVLLLAACIAAPAAPASEPEMGQAAPPVAGAITVSDARARMSPMADGNSAAFLRIVNGTDQPAQLVSAASPAAKVVELHETVDENGVMKMMPHPEGFAVEAGGTLELKPGGKHVMLMGLVEPLAAGASISLTLTFSPELSLELSVPVMEMGGM